jgi:hypothetical protein
MPALCVPTRDEARARHHLAAAYYHVRWKGGDASVCLCNKHTRMRLWDAATRSTSGMRCCDVLCMQAKYPNGATDLAGWGRRGGKGATWIDRYMQLV